VVLEVAPEEVDHEREVLRPVREGLRGCLAIVEPGPEVRDVVAERGHALARHGLPDEVGDQESQERVALDRGEANRGLRVVSERLETLVGQRVDRALACLPGLLACLQVAELG
jgi:hypothetical protein